MSTAKLMHGNSDGYFENLNETAKEIVKEAILKAAQDRKGPEGYKSDEECLEDVECHARDGFMPFSHNRGGLTYRNFTDLMAYFGGGYTVAHEGAANAIQGQIDYTFQSISEDVYTDHKSICLELNIGENECSYCTLQEFEETSENLTENQKVELRKMMNEIQEMESERLSGSENTIMHELRFMYHGKENGVHSASVSAAVNTEGPYHRSSISWSPSTFCEGAKEIEIKWRNNAELKRKLDKAFAKVSKVIF